MRDEPGCAACVGCPRGRDCDVYGECEPYRAWFSRRWRGTQALFGRSRSTSGVGSTSGDIRCRGGGGDVERERCGDEVEECGTDGSGAVDQGDDENLAVYEGKAGAGAHVGAGSDRSAELAEPYYGKGKVDYIVAVDRGDDEKLAVYEGEAGVGSHVGAGSDRSAELAEPYYGKGDIGGVAGGGAAGWGSAIGWRDAARRPRGHGLAAYGYEKVVDLDAFPLRLRRLRESRGLSVRTFADLCGLPRTTLCRYESGESKPSVEGLFAIADAFDVGADELVKRGCPEYGTRGFGSVL